MLEDSNVHLFMLHLSADFLLPINLFIACELINTNILKSIFLQLFHTPSLPCPQLKDTNSLLLHLIPALAKILKEHCIHMHACTYYKLTVQHFLSTFCIYLHKLQLVRTRLYSIAICTFSLC